MADGVRRLLILVWNRLFGEQCKCGRWKSRGPVMCERCADRLYSDVLDELWVQMPEQPTFGHWYARRQS